MEDKAVHSNLAMRPEMSRRARPLCQPPINPAEVKAKQLEKLRIQIINDKEGVQTRGQVRKAQDAAMAGQRAAASAQADVSVKPKATRQVIKREPVVDSVSQASGSKAALLNAQDKIVQVEARKEAVELKPTEPMHNSHLRVATTPEGGRVSNPPPKSKRALRVQALLDEGTAEFHQKQYDTAIAKYDEAIVIAGSYARACLFSNKAEQLALNQSGDKSTQEQRHQQSNAAAAQVSVLELAEGGGSAVLNPPREAGTISVVDHWPVSVPPQAGADIVANGWGVSPPAPHQQAGEATGDGEDISSYAPKLPQAMDGQPATEGGAGGRDGYRATSSQGGHFGGQANGFHKR